MNAHWSMEAVFYHIYTFSLVQAPFYNNHEPQQHKLSEIQKWLPHIKDLGCTAVLFSPLLQSQSHGYDVTDYFKVDLRVGTNEDLCDLVQFFHKNNIRVVLDSVFNHCGRAFFAFEELRNGNRGYADWFSGVDFSRESPMGDPFTYDTWGGYFELPKFNLKNPVVRAYLLDASRYWIDTFQIDGMRLDAANELDFVFMQELRQVTTEKKTDFWLMGEVVHGDYSRWVNNEVLHSVTNYQLFKSLISSHNDNNLYELAHNLQNAVPQQGVQLYTFLDNHDQPRVASHVHRVAFLRPLYALLFTLPGIPSIYYGSEWGIGGVKAKDSDQPLRPFLDIVETPKNIPWLVDFVRMLSKIRREQKAFQYGRYEQRFLAYHKPFVFERSDQQEQIFVAININEWEETVYFDWYQGDTLLDLLTQERVCRRDIVIPAFGVRILKGI